MPPKLDSCVRQVMKDGKSESQAYAICRTTIGAAMKPKKWDDELWESVKQFSKAISASKTYTGVEIARTGSFSAMTGPVRFTTKDFQDAELAYKALGSNHQAVIKLGHNDGQEFLAADGLPNAGFLANVRAQGDRLLADLVDVPDPVAQLLDENRLNARSIEALRNVRIADKRWPFVITGLALLGADLPAVDSLKGLSALYAERGLDIPEADDDETEVVMVLASVEAERAVADAESLIAQLNGLMSQADNLVKYRGGAPKFRAMVRSAVDELRAISKKHPIKSALEVQVDGKELRAILDLKEDASDEEVQAALKERKTLREKVADLEKKVAEKKTVKSESGEEVDVAKLQTNLTDAQKRIVELETAGLKTAAERDVDTAIKAGKFAPASRKTLIELAITAPTQFAAMVKDAPTSVILASQGQKSHGEDDSDDDLGITDMDKRVAAQVGISEDELIEVRAQEKGVSVPEKVKARLEEKRNKSVKK